MVRSWARLIRRVVTVAAVVVAPLHAQEAAPPAETLKGAFPAQKSYSPYAGRNYPARVLWGDTHLHTGYSMDAGAFGARLGPEDAYRFARGEEVTASTGPRVRLSRPLDFLVVADHSDNMGFFPKLFAGDPAMLGRQVDGPVAKLPHRLRVEIELVHAFPP